jgi:hypothetical protein
VHQEEPELGIGQVQRDDRGNPVRVVVRVRHHHAQRPAHRGTLACRSHGADFDVVLIFTRFAGGSFPVPPRRFVAVGSDLLAPAGMPLEAFSGYARQLLNSYNGIRDGHAIYRCAGGRLTRRTTSSEDEERHE